MQDPSSARNRIDALASAVAQEFEATRRVLSFEEWFELLCVAPQVHARNAAQYLRDCFDYYGRRGVRIPSGKVSRFRLFDCDFAHPGGGPQIGPSASPPSPTRPRSRPSASTPGPRPRRFVGRRMPVRTCL